MERVSYAAKPYFQALQSAAEQGVLARLRNTLDVSGVAAGISKGNWCLEKGYSEESYIIRAKTVDDIYGVTVCEVSGNDTYSHLPSPAEAAANAALLVIAPRLYAMVKRMLPDAKDEAARDAEELLAMAVQP